MGSSKPTVQAQEQKQESKTEPWAPAQPLLQQLLAEYGGLDTGMTDAQKAAGAGLVQGAGAIPQFGAQGATAISNLFSADTAPQMGMLSQGYGDFKNNLGATARGDNLNPYNTPGFSTAMDRMSSDITNRVKGVYAGAGRDPSGAGSFAGSLGRGLSEGLAPTIASQYNQNIGQMTDANKALMGAAGSTAGGLAELQQKGLQYGLSALGAQGQVGQAYMTPAQMQLAAANTQYQQPWTNLAQLLNPATQIAGLGGQSSGTSSGTTTVTPPAPSMMSNIIGGASAAASMLPLLMSDERVKDNVEPIGMLNDGQNVYRFSYKGDNTPRIGLLAQEVEAFAPDAVREIGGIKAVEHKRATDRAAALGRRAA